MSPVLILKTSTKICLYKFIWFIKIRGMVNFVDIEQFLAHQDLYNACALENDQQTNKQKQKLNQQTYQNSKNQENQNQCSKNNHNFDQSIDQTISKWKTEQNENKIQKDQQFTIKYIKNSKRKKDHNASKKVNAFAIKCLLNLNPKQNIKKLRRFIHRYDLFVILLMISSDQGRIQQFVQKYSKDQKEFMKLARVTSSNPHLKQVVIFYKKTLNAIIKYEMGDLQGSVEALYDIKNLKCKSYIKQAKSRVTDLFQFIKGNQYNKICEKYMKKRKIINRPNQI